MLQCFWMTCVLIILTVSGGKSAEAQTWQNLLKDGRLDQWQTPAGKPAPQGWVVEADGTLHLKARDPKSKVRGGNLITREQFGDFELWFEFRTVPKGNNGIKYRVRKYGNAWLGLEYQILDDAAFPKLTPEHLTASLYDLVPRRPGVTRINPPGEWNVGKIRVANGKTQHWINGQLTVSTQLFGESWRSYVADSKFRRHEGFGENALGHIMLTDHGSETWFRNLFIRRLNSCVCFK